MKQKKTARMNTCDQYDTVNTFAFLWIALIVLLFIIFGSVGCRTVKTDISKQSNYIDSTNLKKEQSVSVNKTDNDSHSTQSSSRLQEQLQDSSTEVTARFTYDSSRPNTEPVIARFNNDGTVSFLAPGKKITSITIKKRGAAQIKDGAVKQQQSGNAIKSYDSSSIKKIDSTHKTETKDTYHKNKESRSNIIIVALGILIMIIATFMYRNKS